ncbi:GspE/PulE family protein [Defluviitalea raffinosedens]|nr:GspE/PulE family protein [Defluviitalea raffinosedens]MBM7686184.1 type IV pilus assembly protein PilB [Defluviitalea raffinosedens]
MNQRLGDILVNSGLITKKQLDEALKERSETNKKLGEVLIELGYVTEEDLLKTLEIQLGIPRVNLEEEWINPKVPQLISEDLARRHMVFPFKEEDKILHVAMEDPLNFYGIDDLKITTGRGIKPYIATKKSIQVAIERYYGKQSAKQAMEDFRRQQGELEEEIEAEISDVEMAPIVRIVNSIIKQAIISRASDIHIEPFEEFLRVRLRIDGELQEAMRLDINAHQAVVARIKILGKMNIAEKRLPQDGRIEIKANNREIDLRISIYPTVYGEKIVIRLLDRNNFIKGRDNLGFTNEDSQRIDYLIRNPDGILLVTGPTGSGKTTTLYTLLSELNDEHKNIVTVEDPVEYKIFGLNQTSVNPKIGLTFAHVLRSILRQDPDIIMIGEIRDAETSQIAIRAAITGHLVLSTLHTKDTASTIIRLLDMGVEPYLLSSALIGVISQRLVKKICHHCKIAYEPSENELNILKIKELKILYKGEGCNYCKNTGYRGRTAIHEIMYVDQEIRKLINKNAIEDEIKDAAIKNGMTTLSENCKKLVIEGITTVEEFIRISYSLD